MQNTQRAWQALQAKKLFSGAPAANAVTIVVAALFAWLITAHTQDLRVLPWAAGISALALLKLYAWYGYRRGRAGGRHGTWTRRYASLAAIQGLFWAPLFLLVPLPDSQDITVALAILYFGLVISSHALLVACFAAYLGYTAPSTITLLYQFATSGITTYQILALGIIPFYLMMLLLTQRANSGLRKISILESENRELIDRLQDGLSAAEATVQEKTRELATSEEQLRNVIEGARLGFWDWQYQTGDHEVNDRWLDILGLHKSDIRNTVDDWAERIHPEDKDRMIRIVEHAIATHSGYAADFRMRHKQGHWVWIQGSGAVVEYNEQGDPVRLCGTHQEISGRKKIEKELRHQAHHDPLTGLLNRSRLWELLDTEINRDQRYGHTLSLMMLDLDHFKQINDRHGHHFGDQVLRTFAHILTDQVRSSDYPMRYGGEEFVVILPETSQEHALELAERIRLAVQEMDPGSTKLAVTTSIGLATPSALPLSPARLIEAADKALYLAKQNGRNRIETDLIDP